MFNSFCASFVRNYFYIVHGPFRNYFFWTQELQITTTLKSQIKPVYGNLSFLVLLDMWYSKEIGTINTLLLWSRLFQMLRSNKLNFQSNVLGWWVRCGAPHTYIHVCIYTKTWICVRGNNPGQYICHTHIIFNCCRSVENDKNTWLILWPLETKLVNRLYLYYIISLCMAPGSWFCSQGQCWFHDLGLKIVALVRWVGPFTDKNKCNNREANLIIQDAAWLSQTTAWLRSTRQAM